MEKNLKVIIYSTSACVYCRMAKDFFKKNDVMYEEFDVYSDLMAREEMIKKSGQMGVPVIDINGEIFVGFDQRGLEKVLGLEKK